MRKRHALPKFRRGLPGLLLAGLLSAGGAAAAESSPFGVNAHAPQGPQLARQLDQAEAAGIGWIRIDFVWATVEPAQDQFDWRLYDELVAAAEARGIEIFATLAYTPDWATGGPLLSGVPDRAADWTDVCFRAARRYQGSIRYWGLWNEPNLDSFWAGTRQQYLDLILKPGADAIRAGNPDARVAGPELAHLTAGDSDWYDWLLDTLRQAGDRLDVVTHHVYDQDGPRDVTPKLEDDTAFGGTPSFWDVVTPSVKEVLEEAGWLGRPFWLTETGWATDVVGEADQARHYTGLLQDWFTGRPGRDWLDKVFFYELQDDPTPGIPKWGILGADGREKPGYRAYRDFIRAADPGGGGGGGEGDDAAVVSSTIPTAMESRQVVTVLLTVRNTGTTTWTREDGYRLGAVGDSDPFAAPRHFLAPGTPVRPGEQATFTFDMTAPAAGTYATDWQMLREGVARFGDLHAKTVQVAAGPPNSVRRLDLVGGRFTAEVSWRNQHNGTAGVGRAVDHSDETGFFWFFDAGSVELVLKILDGRGSNGRFWVYYGALSDVEYWLRIKDNETGTVRTYHNEPGRICGLGDVRAFPGGPAAGAAPLLALSAPEALDTALATPFATPLAPFAGTAACAPGPRSLCLLGSRFRVEVSWRIPSSGRNGTGTAIPATDESGYFWFFDAGNVELVVKILDGRPITGKFWVFYGALSDVEYTIKVTDTVTNVVKTYHNAAGNLCGRGDTQAL